MSLGGSERRARQCAICVSFTLLELLRLCEMTLTNSPPVLTFKSLSRKLSGHHVSDVPVFISLSLIADVKKLKKDCH